MKDIEFWFSIGSTYSYLSVARLSALERDHFSVLEELAKPDGLILAALDDLAS